VASARLVAGASELMLKGIETDSVSTSSTMAPSAKPDPSTPPRISSRVPIGSLAIRSVASARLVAGASELMLKGIETDSVSTSSTMAPSAKPDPSTPPRISSRVPIGSLAIRSVASARLVAGARELMLKGIETDSVSTSSTMAPSAKPDPSTPPRISSRVPIGSLAIRSVASARLVAGASELMLKGIETDSVSTSSSIAPSAKPTPKGIPAIWCAGPWTCGVAPIGVACGVPTISCISGARSSSE
jgi:hypothetical protein